MRVIYRPFEVERHSDGVAAGDGGVVGPDHVGVSGSEGAGRLCGDHVLRVLEADPEEYVTVPVPSADALRRVEGMDLELKDTGGNHLEGDININRCALCIQRNTLKHKSTYYVHQGQSQKVSQLYMRHFCSS